MYFELDCISFLMKCCQNCIAWWRSEFCQTNGVKPQIALPFFAITPFALLGLITPNSPEVDPVATLASKAPAMKFEKGVGVLRGVLKALDIPIESQVLVFSKTSLQSSLIDRKNPRALYFNDTTYVGFIPGAPLIEIMSVDPVKGALFYTIPNRVANSNKITKEGPNCFRCHGGRGGVPANLFVQSSHVPVSGYPRVFGTTVEVDARTPIQQRWGGWYVSGSHGAMRHMGNEPSTGTDQNPKIDAEKGANVLNLAKYFDTKKYLSPGSDIVALMVMEQQMHIQNLLSQISVDYKDRKQVVPSAVEPLVRALLGSGEAVLSSPVKGTTAFAANYSARGPKDRLGRSLFQLDLTKRLQKYPCSPLIYSPSFDAMNPVIKAAVYERLYHVLSSETPPAEYRHLSATDREAILKIIIETKPEFTGFLTEK